MAYSEGQLNGAQDYRVGIDIWYSGVQSGNSSRFDWNVRIVGTYGSFTNATQYWSASIGGVGYSGTFTLPSGWGSPRILASGSTWIGHDSRGVRPGFASNAYIDTNHTNIGDGGSGDAWVDAPRIPTTPLAPTSVGFSNIGASTMRYQFSGNPDDGGSGILEWQFQLATDAGFTQNLQTFASGGSTDLTGLSNHTTYYARARGRNGIGWSPYSNTSSAATLGHPTVPLSLVATPSTSVTGRVALTWSAPATTGAGGIVGYNIFRNGTQIATTTGTPTGYTDNGLTAHTVYSYTVAARNAYSTSISAVGPQTAAVNATAPGPPSAPQNLTATADGAVPGKVDLSWTAPANIGAGGITGYRVYYAGGAQIVNQNGTATTYSVTGLAPGTTYSFQVFARNALGDTEGTLSPGSNTPTVTPIGEPNAPTGVTVVASSAVSNRLVVSWTAPAGTLTGYNIFRRISGSDTLIGTVNNSTTSFSVDNLTAGTSYTYVVRARTAYTDTLSAGYPGSWGGLASTAVSQVASANSTQAVPSVAAVVSSTNAIFSGTYIINATTANTVGYAKTAANQASSASGGTIVNNTNTTFNGTFTLTATPTPTTMTYAKTASNIAALLTTGGLVTNTSNQAFNGTFTVTAVNVGANTLSYANTAADRTAVAVPVNTPPGQSGAVVNLSNTVFNGTGKILTAITEYTMSYAQTNANVAESNAAGAATNVTNRDVFNGTYSVASIPAYNVVRYARTASNVALRTWIGGDAALARVTSPSTLDVRFRSGWSG